MTKLTIATAHKRYYSYIIHKNSLLRKINSYESGIIHPGQRIGKVEVQPSMPENPLHLMLRLSIAFIWIWTGLVVLFFYPIEDSLALIAPLGLPEQIALLIIWVTAIFEIFLGAMLIANWRVRLWSAIQIGMIGAFTLLVTITAPEMWLHPFGPISKNVPLLAATIILYSWETQRERRRRQLYSFPNEME